MASFDVMPDVQLYQPAELDDALNLADQHGESGTNLPLVPREGKEALDGHRVGLPVGELPIHVVDVD